MRKKEVKQISVGREIDGEIVIRFTDNLMSSHKTEDGHNVVYVTVPVKNKICSLVFDEKIVHEGIYGNDHWIKVSADKSTLVLKQDQDAPAGTDSNETHYKVLNRSLGKYFNYEEPQSKRAASARTRI